MMIPVERYREFGTTGLRVPPIVFSAGPLAGACRVIPEQRRTALCVEWFKRVAPPVVVDVSDRYDADQALAIIDRVVRHSEIAVDELVVCHRTSVRSVGSPIAWVKVAQTLGERNSSHLVAMDGPDNYLAAADSPAERDRRQHEVLDALGAMVELRKERRIRGFGLALRDWRVGARIVDAVPLDWVTLLGGPTVLHHPSGLLEWMRTLAERHVAIVASSVFHGGFLVGGSHKDGRATDAAAAPDQRLFAWRKSFAALCHGYGVTPVEACVQFALSTLGVVSVVVNTSHPDRVAELVAAAEKSVPAQFWAALKDEGLIDANWFAES